MLSKEIRYGGFWRRFAALLLDFVILSPINAFAIWSMFRVRLFWLYYFIPGLLLSLFYGVYLVQRFGGTPGKRIMGLRVATIEGDPIGYRQALLREAPQLVLSQVTSIGMIVASFHLPDSDFQAFTWQDWGVRLGAVEPIWLRSVQRLENAWTWGELLVLLTNRKRRALHDFIAGTVVIDESSNPPLQPTALRAAAERPR